MRVAGYVRNSTDAQAKEETHEVQVEWLKAQAKERGWTLTLYLEPGVSGETIEARPQLQRLLRDVAAGRFDAVAVKRIDRLCRSQNAMAWATISEGLKAAGVQIVSDGMPINLQDPQQALIFQMLGPGIAAFEKATILARTLDGRKRVVREGRKPQGSDPLGLRYVKDQRRFEVVEREAKVIRRMYELAEEGLASREIADRLAAEGHVTRKGAPLTHGRVWQMLKSETYAGTWRFSWGPVPVPPIVDRELWERVQRKVVANRNTRSGVLPSVVRGLAYCERCGLRAHACNTGKAATPYLICSSIDEHHRRKGHKPCGGLWRRPDVDAAVWSLAVRVLSDPSFARKVMARKGRGEDKRTKLERDADAAERRLREIDAKTQGLTMRWSSGLIADEPYDRALASLRGERKLAAARVEEVRTALGALDRAARRTLDALDPLVVYRERLERTTDEERNRVLRALCPVRGVHGVYLSHDGRVELRGILPASESSDVPLSRRKRERSRAFVAEVRIPPKRAWRRAK